MGLFTITIGAKEDQGPQSGSSRSPTYCILPAPSVEKQLDLVLLSRINDLHQHNCSFVLLGTGHRKFSVLQQFVIQ